MVQFLYKFRKLYKIDNFTLSGFVTLTKVDKSCRSIVPS